MKLNLGKFNPFRGRQSRPDWLVIVIVLLFAFWGSFVALAIDSIRGVM